MLAVAVAALVVLFVFLAGAVGWLALRWLAHAAFGRADHW